MAGTAEYLVVMRAQLSVESLPFMPSLAWAARPLASGARSKLIERRSVRCLGVGCPSFGGQRSGSGGSGRIRAELVTSGQPQRSAKRGKVFSAGFNSQTARLVVKATVVRAASTVQWWAVSLCHAEVTALGQRQDPERIQARPNLKCQMREVSTRQGRASGHSIQASSPVVLSRSGHRLVQPGPPNISVKGTSRKRAAPYVGR